MELFQFFQVESQEQKVQAGAIIRECLTILRNGTITTKFMCQAAPVFY